MNLKKQSKNFIAIATFSMALAIALGAFGAHGLKSILTQEMLTVYHTGIQYQFYNTLGLLCLGFLINFKEEIKKLVIASWLVVIGTFIFSFSLYLLVILDMPILGAITPIGGTMLIIGWLITTYSILKDE